MKNLHLYAWPLSRLGEGIEALARQSKHLSGQVSRVPTPPGQRLHDNDETLGRWLEAAAESIGVEVEPIHVRYNEAERLIRGTGPALLYLPDEDGPRFLLLLKSGRRTVPVLTPDLTIHRVPVAAVRATLCQDIEAPVLSEVERLLEQIQISPQRRLRARAAILQEQLSQKYVRGCWILRLPPSANVGSLLRQAKLPSRFLVFAGVYVAYYLLWILSWWVIGRGALQGHLDWGWLFAWILILLTLTPFRLLSTWLEGKLSIRAGALIKQRLLYGALRFNPDKIRHRGVGQLLGLVLESEAVESLALKGGFRGLEGLIELVVATPILYAGAGGSFQLLLLWGWLGLAGTIAWQYFRHRQNWTETRLEMTHDLVERMVGHRTRVVQEKQERLHQGEDRHLNHYLTESKFLDRYAAVLIAGLPRGWLVLGTVGLVPAFVAGQASLTAFAVGLGGLLLAYQAFRKLAVGLLHLVGAMVAWQQIAPLFQAAAHPETSGDPEFTLLSELDDDDPETKAPLLETRNLFFRYADRRETILERCNLQIYPHNRILLEGSSGSGKSTLVSLLIGLRSPQSGLLLLRGLDRQTLGAGGWRRRITAAPQFHENHILTESFAFNLLMGRRWPPTSQDFEEAEAICRELGLGDLLDRMPAGLLQMVGETGWQLSHGEKSRLYLARALLQQAELVVLDESFAALDPENLQCALQCALNRAKTLVVIAHP